MNILWNPNEAVDFIEMPLPLITEGTQDMGDGVYWLKAGTPLDEYFAVANDGDAKYVVAEDFYFISTKPNQAKVVPLITSGYVDINKAEQAAGITYSQDCIDALADAGIVLVDGTLPSSGGGGGGVLVVHMEYDEEQSKTSLDKTWREIRDAVDSMPISVVEVISMFGTESLILGYIMSVGSTPGSSRYGVTVMRPSFGSDGGITWLRKQFIVTSEDGYPSVSD